MPLVGPLGRALQHPVDALRLGHRIGAIVGRHPRRRPGRPVPVPDVVAGVQLGSHQPLPGQPDGEQLKSIRRGEWTEAQVREHFARKETDLETLYQKSTLPYGPDEPAIKRLLLSCLEEHYGSLDKCVVDPDAAVTALREISAVLERHRSAF